MAGLLMGRAHGSALRTVRPGGGAMHPQGFCPAAKKRRFLQLGSAICVTYYVMILLHDRRPCGSLFPVGSLRAARPAPARNLCGDPTFLGCPLKLLPLAFNNKGMTTIHAQRPRDAFLPPAPSEPARLAPLFGGLRNLTRQVISEKIAPVTCHHQPNTTLQNQP